MNAVLYEAMRQNIEATFRALSMLVNEYYGHDATVVIQGGRMDVFRSVGRYGEPTTITTKTYHRGGEQH